MTIIVVLIAWLLVIIALYCYTSKKSVQIDIEKKKEIVTKNNVFSEILHFPFWALYLSKAITKTPSKFIIIKYKKLLNMQIIKIFLKV